MKNMRIDPRLSYRMCDKDIEERLKELLLFHKIVKVEAVNDQVALITLDNGVILETEGNEGCGGCQNGWYHLTELNGCDNAITNVEVSDRDFSIFVFAENRQINLVSYDGHDNGYYGEGFYITAYLPK